MGHCEIVIALCLIYLIGCVYFLCKWLEECKRCEKRFLYLTEGYCGDCWDEIRNE